MTDASVNIRLTATDARFQQAMKRVTATMDNVRRRMEQTARAARAIFIAGQAAAVGSVAAFASFEKVMARVRALTNATDEEFEQLTNTARELGRATTFSANQAGEAMAAFALAGFQVKDIVEALPDTLNLAAVGQLGMGQSAEIAAGIMRGMKIDTEELARVIDVLAAAATSSATDIPQLGEAMKVVGPIAKNAGLSLEETVAVIRSFSDIMIQGGAAGTALRNILLRLTGGTSEVNKALAKLNVTIADGEGNMKSIATIIDDIREAMKQFDEVTQQQILSQLAGARAAAAFSEALTLGGDTIRQYTRELEGAGGTADRVAKQQMDNLIDRFSLLKSAVIEAAIRIGQEFLPIVDGMRTAVNRAVDGFNDMNPAVVKMVVSITALTAGFAAFTVAIKGVAFILGSMTAGIVALKAVLDALAIATTTATSALVAFTVVAKGMATLVGGILVGAIAALTAGILGLQFAMQGLINDLENIGKSGKATADVLRELRRTNDELANAETDDERVALLEKRLQLLRKLEAEQRAQAQQEQARLRSFGGAASGESGRESIQANIDAANRNADRFGEQAQEAEQALTALRLAMLDVNAEQEQGAKTDQTRTELLNDYIAKLTRTKEETRELQVWEGARAAGLADLTATERESIQNAINLANERNKVAAATKTAKDELARLDSQLRVARGTSTEFNEQLKVLAKAGVNPALIRQLMFRNRLLQEYNEENQEEERNRQAAQSIRELIRTDKERLRIEIERINKLRMAGLLTFEEAKRAREVTREKENQLRLERARFDTLDGLFARIQQSAGTFRTNQSLLQKQASVDAAAPRDKNGKLLERNNEKLDGIKAVMKDVVKAINKLDMKSRLS